MEPYADKDVSEWLQITKTIVDNHPLRNQIVELCLKSWESILNSKINTYLNLKIREMSISPQATGALLHDVVPEYIARNINGFRKGKGTEKDIVCEYNNDFSFELKTSSQKSIYGNRSYAKSQEGRSKSGYYLTMNFEKISIENPRILSIKFGWLDHSDWIGQKSETGQQATISKDARDKKLIELYSVDK